VLERVEIAECWEDEEGDDEGRKPSCVSPVKPAVIDRIAMANECDVSKIVTTLLLNTCRLPMRLTVRDLWAVERCALLVNMQQADNKEAGYVPLTSGSVAEFYIDPMLSCVGDIDVMYHRNTLLVIPRGHPPPTQLPAEFHNYVHVAEIDSQSCPHGYVLLQLRYLLTQCPDGGKTYASSTTRRHVHSQAHWTSKDFRIMDQLCVLTSAIFLLTACPLIQ